MRAGEGVDAIEDSFDIDDYTRWRLLEGLDDIGITLGHADDIAAYEADPSELEAGDDPRGLTLTRHSPRCRESPARVGDSRHSAFR